MTLKQQLSNLDSLPLVSVCIPTRNGAEFLEEALNSIIVQDYPNLEIVVSDDKSTDNTIEIIEKFKKKVNHPVFIYYHQPSGIGANWNNCIEKSSGEYIKFLFQDDILFPTCIDEMVKVIKKDNRIGMVASKREILIPSIVNEFQAQWIKNYSDLQKDWDFGKEEIIYLDKEFLIRSQVLKSRQNQIGEPTATLFKRSILKKVGFFREDLTQDLDYEFNNRVLKYYKIAVFKDKLVGFRLHAGQATYLNKNNPYNETRILDHILLREFFWFLDRTQKRNLLLKYFPRFRRIIKLIW